MKKIIKYIIFLLSFCFININVKAETTDKMLKKFDKVPNTYVSMESPYKSTYNYLYIIARASDNKFVYCIQPGISINESSTYVGFTDNYTSYANLTAEQWKKVSLIGYYGYGYNKDGYNHSGYNWYAATQMLMWKVIPSDFDIYFANGFQGKRIEQYVDEMNEIENLVANHYKTPSFNNTSHEMIIGDTITLNDNNNVLSKYTIISTSSNIKASINGNSLNITATNTGNAKIRLRKNNNYYSSLPIVYVAPDTQRVMSAGSVDPIDSEITINIKGGKVIGNKKDKDTNANKPQGDATLKGAKYDLLDENKNYLTTLTTDENGYFESADFLKPNKDYYLVERVASRGYTLDTTEYKFRIDSNTLTAVVNLYEKVIKRKVDLFKVYASGNTQILTPEPNITFEVYNKATGSYYGKLTTNSSGHGNITLPYGTWTFKQINTTPNYEKVRDFDIFVGEENNEPITRIISNAEITAKLRVVKTDADTKQIVVKDGIKFKIKNLDTGDYVCQNITYPSQNRICTFETKDGAFITPYALSLGRYQIEELEEQSIDGYVWNSKPLKFTIDQNSKFIYDTVYGVMHEVHFENKQVKGEFELTKYGEDYKIKDGKFIYYEKLLDKVKYSLYADEDIISGDGTLIYKKGTKITTFETNNGKYKMSNLYLGKYKLVEEKTDINHILSTEPIYFELKYKDQYTEVVKIELTDKNYLKKGNLDFSKIDFNTKKPLPNTKIEFHIEYNNEDILVNTYITDKSGNVLIKNIPLLDGAKYYIKEIEAPEGYVINQEKMYFKIKNNETTKCTMSNKLIEGNLKFRKIDKKTKKPIKDTLIRVEDMNGNIIYKGKTDKDGYIIVKNIKYGKYKIFEELASTSYVKIEKPIEFEIKNNNEIVEVEMTNDKIKAKVRIYKTDSNGNFIPNVKISIFTENDDFIGEFITNEFGFIEKELEYGKYYYKEVETVEGLILNEEKVYFSITENNVDLEFTLVNEIVPNTLKNKNYFVEGIIASIVLFGIGLLIYGKKKN